MSQSISFPHIYSVKVIGCVTDPNSFFAEVIAKKLACLTHSKVTVQITLEVNYLESILEIIKIDPMIRYYEKNHLILVNDNVIGDIFDFLKYFSENFFVSIDDLNKFNNTILFNRKMREESFFLLSGENNINNPDYFKHTSFNYSINYNTEDRKLMYDIYNVDNFLNNFSIESSEEKRDESGQISEESKIVDVKESKLCNIETDSKIDLDESKNDFNESKSDLNESKSDLNNKDEADSKNSSDEFKTETKDEEFDQQEIELKNLKNILSSKFNYIIDNENYLNSEKIQVHDITIKDKRTYVYLQFVIKDLNENSKFNSIGEDLGTIHIELYDTLCPESCQQFLTLCQNSDDNSHSYINANLTRILKDGFVQFNMKKSESSQELIPSNLKSTIIDENYSLNFDAKLGGILSFIKESNFSYNISPFNFIITLNSYNYFNDKLTGFGRIVQGYNVLKKINSLEVSDHQRLIRNSISIIKTGLSKDLYQQKNKISM